LDLSRIHNDSTTVKACGKIPGTTLTGLSLKLGKSKDHRPDLKQIVYCLTISADGAVPIHYKTYPGNRTDDTTHIETWDTMKKLSGRSDFLYVADCKVCTDKQLSHITVQGGRVLTVMPETWKETKIFKGELRLKRKPKRIIWRREISVYEHETFSYFVGKYLTLKRGYTLHWICSSEKKKQDRQRREESLRKAEHKMMDLISKLNKRNLKTKKQILGKVNAILDSHRVNNFYKIDISEVKEQYIVQIGKGRPGPNTQYKTIVKTVYSLSWARIKKALSQEKNVDGIFPLLCTDKSLTAKEALIAYKYQPRLEKRFTQFKSIHNAAPLLFKKIERVEAIMFLFFLSLIIQAVIEREIRLKMKENDIDTLPVYPEDRLSCHPTTAKIFYKFEGISVYHLEKGAKVTKEFKDTLTKTHKKILELLQIPECQYWP
jgi:transposase